MKNTTTNTTIAAHVVNSGTNATITFPGNLPLPNGDYVLTISAAGVSGAGGQLDGNGDGVGGDDFTFSFFFQNADADRNHIVNTSDFMLLAQNFGKTSATFGQGDFNYDGVINALDFSILASNFGLSVEAPPLLAAEPFDVAAEPIYQRCKCHSFLDPKRSKRLRFASEKGVGLPVLRHSQPP